MHAAMQEVRAALECVYTLTAQQKAGMTPEDQKRRSRQNPAAQASYLSSRRQHQRSSVAAPYSLAPSAESRNASRTAGIKCRGTSALSIGVMSSSSARSWTSVY